MSWANRITILRVLLIPVFVTLMIYYANSVQAGAPQEWLLLLGCAVFALAAVSDGVDGYIARRYNQKSRLGTFLDPLADKALLISAIVLLSVNHGDAFVSIPAWLAVTVISRDVILAIGAFVIQMVVGNVTVRPRIIGKISTVTQMLVVGWTMLQISDQPPVLGRIRTALLVVAGVATIVSGLWYIYDGAKQLGNESKTSAPRNA